MCGSAPRIQAISRENQRCWGPPRSPGCGIRRLRVDLYDDFAIYPVAISPPHTDPLFAVSPGWPAISVATTGPAWNGNSILIFAPLGSAIILVAGTMVVPICIFIALGSISFNGVHIFSDSMLPASFTLCAVASAEPFGPSMKPIVII